MLPLSLKEQLRLKGIELPPPFRSVGLYKPVSIDGNRLYVSGHGPWVNGKPIVGKLGWSLDLEEGKAAARQVGLGILSTIENEVGLDRIERLYRAFGMVNANPTFTSHPEVIDGFSELMQLAFGPEHGVGARSAIGVASLPFNIAVEVECEFILYDLCHSALASAMRVKRFPESLAA